MLHKAMADFAHEHPTALPADIAGEVMRLANEVVREMTGVPSVAAFWLPRLERFARWFAETEPGRRAGGARPIAEIKGELVLAAPGGDFKLTARADRIDLANGAAKVTDYKTGTPASWKQVVTGFAPQLPLEAAMLMAGAFDGLAPLPVAGLHYIRASGGEPPGEERRLDASAEGIAGIARDALAGAERLIATFDNGTEPYRAIRRPGAKYDYDDYAHLARVAEWLGSAGEEAA